MMQLRQFRYAAIQSGSFAQSRYSVIKPDSDAANGELRASNTFKMPPLKKFSSISKGRAKLVTLNEIEEEQKV